MLRNTIMLCQHYYSAVAVRENAILMHGKGKADISCVKTPL